MYGLQLDLSLQRVEPFYWKQKYTPFIVFIELVFYGVMQYKSNYLLRLEFQDESNKHVTKYISTLLNTNNWIVGWLVWTKRQVIKVSRQM